jgi:hypothetical protein
MDAVSSDGWVWQSALIILPLELPVCMYSSNCHRHDRTPTSIQYHKQYALPFASAFQRFTHCNYHLRKTHFGLVNHTTLPPESWQLFCSSRNVPLFKASWRFATVHKTSPGLSESGGFNPVPTVTPWILFTPCKWSLMWPNCCKPFLCLPCALQCPPILSNNY